jgi:hypothetical protein
VTIPQIAIHAVVRYFNTCSVATQYSREGVGSKSMDTRVSFIGQMSESILRQILLKNFYNLRQAIPKYDYWHNFSVFIQSYPSRKKNHKHNFKVTFQKYLALHRPSFSIAAEHLCFCM